MVLSERESALLGAVVECGEPFSLRFVDREVLVELLARPPRRAG